MFINFFFIRHNNLELSENWRIMGSNSSLMDSSKSSSSPRKLSGPSGSIINRTKRKLSSFFCASFNSRSTFELEDCPGKSFVTDTKKIAPVSSDFHDSMVESSSVLSPHMVSTSSLYENGDSSRRNSSIVDEAFVESSMINLRTSTDQIDFSNTRESLPFQPGEELVSENATNRVSTADATAEITPFICAAHDQSRSLSQGLTVSRADVDSDYNYSDLRSLSIVSDSVPRFQFPGDDHSHMTTISSPGLFVSNSDQDLRNVLHLDELSTSSNLLFGERSNESRINGRRLSRRNFSESPTILLTGDLADEHPGFHMRQLFDSGGNLDYNGAGYNPDSRRHHRSERRRQFTSEIDERIIGSGLREGGRETTLCVSGLHPDGTCSCDSFLTAEESSTLESISRIIMLAEALFEVLNEIHHQSLSLSESLLPLPAPESLVDTFPLKYHEKVKNIESYPSYVQQCYICLADYEDGDRLRVLPCNHEYHVPCIDKWLKEINRVCPLCRHNVCDGAGECSASNMAMPS
ncbi:uncharacterized protein [Primulina eburnea]|uniref:uncharacterized protein n=1 Tax=Primulina eburnea TaxID=1245227 RepID=UPI003C6C0F06